MRLRRLIGLAAGVTQVALTVAEDALQSRGRGLPRSQLEDENQVLRARVHVLEQEIRRLEDLIAANPWLNTMYGEDDDWTLDDCYACESERLADDPGEWLKRRFIVCPFCGNKHCPRATHHGNQCTNSNESGQPGSRFQ